MKNTFKTGLIGLAALAASCSGNGEGVKPQTKESLIVRCANNLSLCARKGYENFAAIGEGETKQNAFDDARYDITKQVARYLHGTEIVDSQTSVRTSVGKASELPQTNDYEIKQTQFRVTRGKIPKILWESECFENGNGSKCYVVGYIP